MLNFQRLLAVCFYSTVLINGFIIAQSTTGLTDSSSKTRMIKRMDTANQVIKRNNMEKGPGLMAQKGNSVKEQRMSTDATLARRETEDGDLRKLTQLGGKEANDLDRRGTSNEQSRVTEKSFLGSMKDSGRVRQKRDPNHKPGHSVTEESARTDRKEAA